MEEIGLCLEVAQVPQSLARALVLGANVCQYLPALFGLTEGPHIALFKRFQISWPYIDQTLSFKLRW